MRKTLFFLLALLPVAGRAQTAVHTEAAHTGKDGGEKLRLVVNIVVSQLPYDMLERYRAGLSDEGFVKFAEQGVSFSAAHHDYMQTVSPVGLATITTGMNPSMHGVVSYAWVDYVTNKRISLIDDAVAKGIECEPDTECFSPRRLTMPSLGDKLLDSSPESRVVSIALDPVSAIVMGGRKGQAYWMERSRASWISSTHYMESLPAWLTEYNATRPATFFVPYGWTLGRPTEQYISRTGTLFQGKSKMLSFEDGRTVNYARLLASPAGNSLTAQFAERVVTSDSLGMDDAVDMLYVCFDASRYIGQTYGVGSMETEDMLYKLDYDLSSMVRAITAAVGEGHVLWVLTSDHGANESWNPGTVKQDKFVANQFKALLNSFLNVQFGAGDWVLDYIDRQVYLNHNFIYQKGLNLVEIQNRSAAFALEFRGVSHVLTSTALSNGYFGGGYGAKMQSSFYPRRAGDLMLNLMPDWIEERPDKKSLSGSMYDYDTHVPLIIFGSGITPARVAEHVDITRIAPTLARLMGVGRPIASDENSLPGVINGN